MRELYIGNQIVSIQGQMLVIIRLGIIKELIKIIKTPYSTDIGVELDQPSIRFLIQLLENVIIVLKIFDLARRSIEIMEIELLKEISLKLDKLESIESKISKLDSIENEVKSMNKTIKKMQKDIKDINSNIDAGIYEDLEKIKARINKLEQKAI